MLKQSSNTYRKTAGMKIIWRYIVVSSFVLLFAGLIARSMIKTTIIDANKWIEKANRQLQQRDTIWPERGDILAADGSVLATNVNNYAVRIDFKASKFDEKQFRADLPALCDTLAMFFPERTARQWADKFNAELAKPAKERSSSFTLLRDVNYDQAEMVKTFPYFRRSTNPNRTGLTRDTKVRRIYPYGEMARRSIGRAGMTHYSEAVHGVSGLEFALDSLLCGRPGMSKKVPLTHNIVDWEDIPAVPGYTLTTTIDVAMQDIVENELISQLDSLKAEWGTVVLMEVNTGDIKAIANFERNDEGRYVESMNHAIRAYEPGSVIKTVSMVVALEDGFVKGNPDNDFYHIETAYRYGGTTIKGFSKAIDLPVSRFLERSSNVGMVKLIAPHFADNPNGFRERVRELGFLDPLNTGIAGERPPYYPTLDLKVGGLADLAHQAYGYTTLVPPLYTCAFYNAVANDGCFVRPRLVTKISTPAGDSIIPVSYVRKQMCSPQTAATVREMLHRVVHGGDGTARWLKTKLGKVDIACKTGTSKVAREMSPEDREKLRINRNDTTVKRPKGYIPGAYRYAFCGFFPYEKPRYTCMVLISQPEVPSGSAARVSGIVLVNIANRMYSRGMFGDNPAFAADAELKPGDNVPVLYASHDAAVSPVLSGALSAKSVKRLSTPAKTAEGTVPDVKGLGLRQAIYALESKGYNVTFTGNGAVLSQYPAAGARVAPGTRITLTLEQR